MINVYPFTRDHYINKKIFYNIIPLLASEYCKVNNNKVSKSVRPRSGTQKPSILEDSSVPQDNMNCTIYS